MSAMIHDFNMSPIHSDTSFIPFDKEEIESSIPDRFRRVAALCSERIALKKERTAITYNTLDKDSDRAAHAILSCRGTGRETVALLFNQGIEAVTALLGVLKSGKCYVALDPSYPRTRLSDILEDTQSSLILSDTQHLGLAADLAYSRKIINIADLDSHFSGRNIKDISVSPDSPAVIFYSSGSTGKPKGILRNHRLILYLARSNACSYRICPGDRQAVVGSYLFAGTLSDMFAGLLNGSALCLYNVSEAGTDHLAQWLTDEEITLFHPPVTFFRQFASLTSDLKCFPKLRLIRLGGQGIYKRDLDIFMKHLPDHCVVSHGLSSTETGRNTCLFIHRQIHITDHVVPAGYALEDKEILILDENRRKLGFDEIGEIAVRSRYLSTGYWRNPELTDQKFLPDPEGGDKRIYLTGDLGRMRPDGCLEHLGRKDFQVKIRGYRVEMSSIEAELYDLDAVKEAAVTAHDHPSGDKYLVAYIVPAKQPPPTVTALRSALSEKLPEYMIPSAFVIMEKLPLTTTGKIDRFALPAPDRIRPELDTPFAAPRTPAEKMLADIWAEILELDRVGIHDNFFELGGDSILAIRLFARIEKNTGRKIPLAILFRSPTIEQLALKLSQKENLVQQWTYLVLVQAGAPDRPPFFYVPQNAITVLSVADLLKYIGSEQPFYGFQPRGFENDLPPHERIEDIAADYIREMREVQSEGPYFLGGRCLGGLVVFEMALQLLSLGQRVAFLGILDTLVPPGTHHKIRQRIAREKGIHPSQVTFPRHDPFKYRPAFTPEQNRRIRQIKDVHHKARVAYIPRYVYPGKITFFRSDTPHAVHRSGWEGLADRIEFHDVPGDHHSIGKEPHVRVLGAKLKACLEYAQADEADRWVREFSLKSLN